jgi:hypothetical protein
LVQTESYFWAEIRKVELHFRDPAENFADHTMKNLGTEVKKNTDTQRINEIEGLEVLKSDLTSQGDILERINQNLYQESICMSKTVIINKIMDPARKFSEEKTITFLQKSKTEYESALEDLHRCKALTALNKSM